MKDRFIDKRVYDEVHRYEIELQEQILDSLKEIKEILKQSINKK